MPRPRAEEFGRDSPRQHCGEGPASVRSSGPGNISFTSPIHHPRLSQMGRAGALSCKSSTVNTPRSEKRLFTSHRQYLFLRAGQSARHPTCRRNQSGSDRHHGNDHRNGGRVAAEGHARVGRGSGSSIRSQFSHHSGLTHDPGVEPASSGARVADPFARYPHAIASSYAPARSAYPHIGIADCDHHRCLRVV